MNLLPAPATRSRTIPRELDDLVVKLMAKSPADRPWDAAAVEPFAQGPARQGRPGRSRSHGLARAWIALGQSYPSGSRNIRTAHAEERPQGGTLAGLSYRVSQPARRWQDRSRLLNRRTSRDPRLVAALIAIGGFIAYWLWPPSAEYLYRQAATLMASSHRSDWITARDEYFDTLDRKHPDHPYKEQLRKWRDQIILDEADGRARNLSSTVQTQFSEPHTNAERQYVSFDVLATKAAGEGNEAWRP